MICHSGFSVPQQEEDYFTFGTIDVTVSLFHYFQTYQKLRNHNVIWDLVGVFISFLSSFFFALFLVKCSLVYNFKQKGVMSMYWRQKLSFLYLLWTWLTW